MKTIKTREIVQISAFSAILVLCSWISIPSAVPFTLQTFGVFLAAGLLGTKKATAAVTVYILLGILGLPVFSGGRSGLGVLLGQTGGYITGFLIGVFVCGICLKPTRKRHRDMAVSMLIGQLCIYIFGSLWFSLVYLTKSGVSGFWMVVSTAVVPFVIPDIIKIALAVFAAGRISKYIRFTD